MTFLCQRSVGENQLVNISPLRHVFWRACRGQRRGLTNDFREEPFGSATTNPDLCASIIDAARTTTTMITYTDMGDASAGVAFAFQSQRCNEIPFIW